MQIKELFDKELNRLKNVTSLEYFGFDGLVLPEILYSHNLLSFYGFGSGVSLGFSLERETNKIIFLVNCSGVTVLETKSLSEATFKYDEIELICKLEHGVKGCKMVTKSFKDGSKTLCDESWRSSVIDSVLTKTFNK